MGAPRGNRNAERHGAYATVHAPGSEMPGLPGIIRDLHRRLTQLSSYIDYGLEREGVGETSLDLSEYAQLVSLQGQLASRLGRLMRDQHRIAGDAAGELTEAVNAALDDISAEWGIEL